MDNRTFDKLPPRLQLAYAVGVASALFGHDTTLQFYRHIAPLVSDLFGHGESSQSVPVQEDLTGEWRIYEAL